MDLDDEVLYKPSKWGSEFHALKVREALGAGSAGPGKSMVLLMDPMQQAIVEHQRALDPKHPHKIKMGRSQGWALHLRRHFPMLQQTIVRAKLIFPSIDPKVRWIDDDHMFVFESGFRYQFGHCQNRDDWEQYQSNQYTWIGYDELVQFEEEQYHQINARLRSGDPVLKKMLAIRAMSNPFAKREGNINVVIRNPHWVRERFVDPAPEGRVILEKEITLRNGKRKKRQRIYLPAKLWDNPDPAFVEGYEEELRDKPAHIREAMLEGNWYVNVGSFFGEEWDSNVHVRKPFVIPSDWKRFRALDWGYKTNGVCLWLALDNDNTLIVEHEFSFKNMDAKTVAKRIKEREKRCGLWHKGRSAITGVADTQLWEKRGDVGLSKAAEMAKVGVHWKPADKRSRVRNAERVMERLTDHEGGLSIPGLVFFKNCRKTVETVPQIQIDPDDPECPAKGGKDHWYDALSYACAYASRGGDGVPAPKYVTDEDDEESSLERATKRNGRRGGYG